MHCEAEKCCAYWKANGYPQSWKTNLMFKVFRSFQHLVMHTELPTSLTRGYMPVQIPRTEHVRPLHTDDAEDG